MVFDLFSWLAIGRAPDTRYVCLEIVSMEINDSDLHIWADIGNGIVDYHKIHERLCLLNKFRFSFFLDNFRYVAYNTAHKNNWCIYDRYTCLSVYSLFYWNYYYGKINYSFDLVLIVVMSIYLRKYRWCLWPYAVWSLSNAIWTNNKYVWYVWRKWYTYVTSANRFWRRNWPLILTIWTKSPIPHPLPEQISF